jgi:DNA-binding GntR family transcriptional regulator
MASSGTPGTQLGPSGPFADVDELPAAATIHVYDHVYRLVRHALVSGTIKPGTRLVEAELAGRLHVSRTPVRDALRRLEADGLLQRVGRGGLMAAEVQPDEVEDIFRVRRELDRLAAALATERAGPEAWEGLRQRARALGESAVQSGFSSFEFNQAHTAFHAVIYQLAFAPRVATMLQDRVLSLVEIASELSYVGSGGDGREEPVAAEHLELVEALASGDATRAVAAALAHCAAALTSAIGPSADAGSVVRDSL